MYKLAFILSLIFMLSIQTDKYPIPPKTKERLFYIQRNHNSNTIVYDAKFDASGNLLDSKPVDVYWLRYDEDGRRMELRSIEKRFAYGIDCKKKGGGYYQVKLVAYEDKVLWLKQISPNKAVVYTNIGGKTSILDHLYIFADNSSFWPKVKYVELFGKDAKTGKATYEKINN